MVKKDKGERKDKGKMILRRERTCLPVEWVDKTKPLRYGTVQIYYIIRHGHKLRNILTGQWGLYGFGLLL